MFIRNFLVKMSIAAVLLTVFTLKFVDRTIGERLYEHPLEIAWKATGLELSEVSTESWLRVSNRWMSTFELKTLSNQIITKLQLKLNTKIITGEQDGFTYASFEGRSRDQTVVTVTLQSTRNDDTVETQLGVNTSHGGTINNFRFYLDHLRENITGLGKNGHFAILLQGESKGRIAPAIVRELSGKAFRKLNAELVNSAFEGGNSNQKGYTRLLIDEVTYDSKPVNIEIGTRYDQANDVTEVVMGTPDINDGS